MKYFTFLSLVIAFGLLVAGCGDDDSGDASATIEPTGPTADATAEPIRRTESVAALRTYLAEVGLDGSTGVLTDPVECRSLPASDTEGDFCLLETSVYAAALALILVADVDDQDNSVWQVRVVLEDGSWQVTEAIAFDSE